jgi:drug/metabolite transporter (DMT)-like permease
VSAVLVARLARGDPIDMSEWIGGALIVSGVIVGEGGIVLADRRAA